MDSISVYALHGAERSFSIPERWEFQMRKGGRFLLSLGVAEIWGNWGTFE